MLSEEDLLGNANTYKGEAKREWQHNKKFYCPAVNVKMKMYKNADSKCTILASRFWIEYTLFGSDENELQKRHLWEGEIYA